MPTASQEACQGKLDRYKTAQGEYIGYMDEALISKASYDFRVEQLIEEDIPAKDEKVEERQGKLYEIQDLLGGASEEAAQSASGRIDEIDIRLGEINDRLNEIMGLLDGAAEPMEVPLLFSEGDALAQERDELLSERSPLVVLVETYNAVRDEVTQLDSDVQALQEVIERMEEDINTLESEAMADYNYFEEQLSYADTQKYRMLEIEGTWEDYGCSDYGMDLPGFDEEDLDLDDIPEDDESPLDTGDYEIPEEIDDPGEPDEGDEWDPEDYEDTG